MEKEKTGRIIKAVAGYYYCQSEGDVYACRGKGAFRSAGITPLVGDRVRFSAETTWQDSGEDRPGLVTEILERKNQFTRPPVANLDQLFLVAAVADPSPSTLVIDKLLAVCEHKKIRPVLVITKIDLGGEEELRQIYEGAGYPVVCLSNLEESEAALSRLREMMKGQLSALAGNSGVGKSSLLNRLEPSLELSTAHISRRLGRGKHTTRQVELFYLPGAEGYVADTPGFGTMELAQYGRIHRDELQYCFREFSPYLEKCRFTGCSHTTEKGCAVLEALAEGKIGFSRHESYRALYEEARQIPDWAWKKESD